STPPRSPRLAARWLNSTRPPSAVPQPPPSWCSPSHTCQKIQGISKPCSSLVSDQRAVEICQRAIGDSWPDEPDDIALGEADGGAAGRGEGRRDAGRRNRDGADLSECVGRRMQGALDADDGARGSIGGAAGLADVPGIAAEIRWDGDRDRCPMHAEQLAAAEHAAGVGEPEIVFRRGRRGGTIRDDPLRRGAVAVIDVKLAADAIPPHCSRGWGAWWGVGYRDAGAAAAGRP